ncbi:MAG TPA: 3'-5' exonuclease [Burkholderiaceae bacterium]|nr:3'-5' exonuclease [Burkholderiaceae bacterium]
MTAERPSPDKDEIAALEPFERLPLERIELVVTGAQAERAAREIASARALGFDTESKPTFAKGEVSDGPHIVQLATPERAWVFQLHEPACVEVLAALLAAPTPKVGFGLGDDLRRIRAKLGVEPAGVIDLNHVFRARGYRKDIGVKAAVAIVFGRRFAKSGRASTSNWAARRLAESQLLYAANDAWAAVRVFDALGPGALAPPVPSAP